MKKIIVLFILCLKLISPAQADLELSEILKLTPGLPLKNELKTKSRTKEYSYQIEIKDNQIQSVAIEFEKPMDSKSFLSPDEKGFCLVQSMKGDVNIKNYYFFDQSLKKRFEFTPDKKIISIHIQEMPGARQHTPCTPSHFKFQGDQK